MYLALYSVHCLLERISEAVCKLDFALLSFLSKNIRIEFALYVAHMPSPPVQHRSTVNFRTTQAMLPYDTLGEDLSVLTKTASSTPLPWYMVGQAHRGPS